jgi:hypothetical protein
MLCVYIEVVRVANDYLNCLEVEVGVTLVGALAHFAHYSQMGWINDRSGLWSRLTPIIFKARSNLRASESVLI